MFGFCYVVVAAAAVAIVVVATVAVVAVVLEPLCYVPYRLNQLTFPPRMHVFHFSYRQPHFFRKAIAILTGVR